MNIFVNKIRQLIENLDEKFGKYTFFYGYSKKYVFFNEDLQSWQLGSVALDYPIITLLISSIKTISEGLYNYTCTFSLANTMDNQTGESVDSMQMAIDVFEELFRNMCLESSLQPIEISTVFYPLFMEDGDLSLEAGAVCEINIISGR